VKSKFQPSRSPPRSPPLARSPPAARRVPADLVGCCFNCFANDHVNAQCPLLTRCFHCDRLGHRFEDCDRPWVQPAARRAHGVPDPTPPVPSRVRPAGGGGAVLLWQQRGTTTGWWEEPRRPPNGAARQEAPREVCPRVAQPGATWEPYSDVAMHAVQVADGRRLPPDCSASPSSRGFSRMAGQVTSAPSTADGGSSVPPSTSVGERRGSSCGAVCRSRLRLRPSSRGSFASTPGGDLHHP
jgi:hypothetical protein